MKEFKAHILEYSLIGSTNRTIIVKAKDLESAKRKVQKIQGNREWTFEVKPKES